MKFNKLLPSLLITTLIVQPVFAMDTYMVPETGTPKYQFNIFQQGEYIKAVGEEYIGFFDLSQQALSPLFKTALDWYDLLKVNANTPALYSVVSVNDYNAFAGSPPVSIAESPYKISWINAILNNKTITTPPEELEEYGIVGFVGVGLGVNVKYSGWAQYTGRHGLYHGEIPDLYVVMEHEIMHSLGVSSNVSQCKEGDETYYFSEGPTDSLFVFDKDLRVFSGTGAYNPAEEIIPSPGDSVGKNEDFDIFSYSPYFVGEKAIKVLGGDDDYDTARANINAQGGIKNYSSSYLSKLFADEDRYKNVYGLPIHPYDSGDEPDLSHLELRNSYMSHQEFRNWLVPMEVELALLQDIGYTNINLKDHFGKSYYLNQKSDTFTDGFNGTYAQAVGIHIYGNENNITQASNISTTGEGSFGVRIDGSENTYTLKNGNSINSNGKENIALGVTWGHGHTLNVEPNSSIKADGEDGIGVSFDFGANLFGIKSGAAKGSYIHYDPEDTENYPPEVETIGALVEDFNVAGNIEGKKAAIYISDNAYVKNINFEDKANIKGDIISEWNSYSSNEDAKVLKPSGSPHDWVERDLEDENDILYTDLNFAGANSEFTVEGNITGENKVYNTLRVDNEGILNYKGGIVAVNTINNEGNIKLDGETVLSVQDGEITDENGAGGIITVGNNSGLTLANNVKSIDNTVNFGTDGYLSTLDNKATDVTIKELNTNNTKLFFDLGDGFELENDSSISDTAVITQVNASEDILQQLSDGASIELFKGDNVLDVSGSANVYYNGNKFTFEQNTSEENYLTATLTSTDVELSDAVEDSTAGNYVVTENKLTKDAGTVKGNTFEISGEDIDVNSNKGLVIDGGAANNPNGTTLKTGIYGASDSDLTVQNNGKLTVASEDATITLGKRGETAISLNTGSVDLNAGQKEINVLGDIQGNDTDNDKISLSGSKVSLNKANTVAITSSADKLNINNTVTNSDIQINSGMMNIANDAFLASDGTNSLMLNGGGINLANNAASNITLNKLELNDDIKMTLDVDLSSLSTDRFVFNNSDDVETNGMSIEISNINIINPNAVLTKAKYEIPFVSAKYNNEKLADNIDLKISKQLLTPVYKYRLGYEDGAESENIVLNRSNTGGYQDYNPAVYTGAVAAQAGGFLTQINSYENAFSNMDMLMAMPKSARTAMKYRNKYAMEGEGANLVTFNPNQNPQEAKGVWFRPYATFEKVGMKNGPKVSNIGYGSYFGGDSDIIELKHGWDVVLSGYAGYNGSHQHYDGNSVYQNGGQLGATSVFYRNNFFSGLTANVGAGVANASTMYGNDDIVLLTSGVASKTGYNFGFKDDKFIIQPSWLMSYTFVNTFDYTNAAGVRITSDPLNAMQLVPGIKFIGNLKNNWQPYFGVQMVWNIMEKSKFKANDAYLEQIGIRPYVQYGIGVQKTIGERVTGFAQSMVRNGGRNGVALTAGFRIKI